MSSVTLTVLLKVPLPGVGTFQAYEDRVLPLVREHGGVLQRRLRTSDGSVECHILHFASRDGLDNFRNDPRRAEAAPMLAACGAVADIFEMHDVEVLS